MQMPIKVAIVEDNQDIRESLWGMITGNRGFECVAECGSGEQALEKLPKLKPDVALLHIGLPGISRIECIQTGESLFENSLQETACAGDYLLDPPMSRCEPAGASLRARRRAAFPSDSRLKRQHETI